MSQHVEHPPLFEENTLPVGLRKAHRIKTAVRGRSARMDTRGS